MKKTVRWLPGAVTLGLLAVFAATATAQTPASKCMLASKRFVPDASGGVLDTRTRLVWSRCLLPRGFDPANQKCVDSAYITDAPPEAARAMPSLARQAGQDWRMPTVAELRAVFDTSCTADDFRRSPFADVAGGPLWSSSKDAAGKVWQLDPQGKDGPEYYTVERGAATFIGVRPAAKR